MSRSVSPLSNTTHTKTSTITSRRIMPGPRWTPSVPAVVSGENTAVLASASTAVSTDPDTASRGSRFGPLWSSLDGKWTTPRSQWDTWNAEFDFGLDAAALSTSALCSDWLGPDHPESARRDALAFDHWAALANGGAVWCNPPYGRGVDQWCQRAAATANEGTRVVMLLPSRTGTRWFHDHVLGQAEIRFLKGRLKFGDAATSAPFDSLLLVY